MITKMKKLTFLVYHKEYEDFLNNLRELGVVHVAEKQSGTLDNEELQENMRMSAKLLELLNQLEAVNAANKQIPDEQGSSERGMEVLNAVEEMTAEKGRLTQQLQTYAKDEATLLPWGDFSWETIHKLHDAGYELHFHLCQEQQFKEEWIELYNATVINKQASKLYFVTITKLGEDIDLDVETLKLPKDSLSTIHAKMNQVQQALDAQVDVLRKYAQEDSSSVKAALSELRLSIEFSKVVLNTASVTDDKLKLLQGWIPIAKEEGLRNYMDKEQLYYEISDPTSDDDVPILLKNKGIFAWFEPICKLYMLPKYGELDLTPFFAPFFMVFFGLCLGDIGYGLLLLLMVTAYKAFGKNIGASMKSVLSLVQLLGFSTMICGLLTGGFFGFSLFEIDTPIFQKLKSFALDNNQMFQLSLVLGVIQILFGMILKVVNLIIQLGFKYAVGTLGWVILLVSTLFAYLFPAIMPMGETVHLVILGISALMIFLYNSPDKNIFINFGLGLWDTYNMATGLLGDILSYVRLFALGLSGGILASVFNNLAAGLAPDNVVLGPIVMVLIFLIGHAINIFMNVLGALVHPMRLTFVEFFKNAGYEGGGREYKPFSK